MSTRRLAAFALLGGGAFFLSPVLFGSGGGEGAPFKPFALFSDPRYTPLEVGALMAVLGVAVAGLLYALMLARQVLAADTGTKRMQEVAEAVREGSNAYLAAQFKKIGPLIIVLTFLCGLLPIIGNIISNTLIAGVAFTISPKMAVIALVYLVVIHKLEYFLNSKIIGDRIKTPMWLTLLGIVLGEKLMGIPGMILAPVVLHYIKVEASQNKSADPQPVVAPADGIKKI